MNLLVRTHKTYSLLNWHNNTVISVPVYIILWAGLYYNNLLFAFLFHIHPKCL